VSFVIATLPETFIWFQYYSIVSSWLRPSVINYFPSWPKNLLNVATCLSHPSPLLWPH